jgi:hypothetical protein
MKQKNIAIIDTETAGGFGNLKIYDFGIVVMTQKGEIVAEYESLVREVFVPKEMATAYYSEKISCYYSMMYDGMRIRDWDTIRDDVNAILEKHNVGIISAYNLGFDMRAIKSAQTKYSKHDKFLNANYDLLDLWYWSCEELLNKKTYHKFAKDNQFITDCGNVKTSAEVGYSFINNLPNFIESHTALDDCFIEADICKKLLARKVKKPLNKINGSPWRLAQPKKEKAKA